MTYLAWRLNNKMSLTDIKCRNAKPAEKGYRLADSHGLYLWVTPAGGKVWRRRYYFPKGGKEKTIVIGKYPSISLQEARTKTLEYKKMVSQNIDPMEVQKKELQELNDKLNNTFESVAHLWFNHKENEWTERTRGYVKRRLEQHVFPHIGKISINTLNRKQIIEALRFIEDKGYHDLANKIASYCYGICTYAYNEEIIQHNPGLELTKSLKPYKKEHHAHLEAHEIPAFLKAIDNNDARLHMLTRHAMRLLLLTFVRTNELIGAEWEEIDFTHAQWTIPANRMKTRKSHIVPLSKQAIRLFGELKDLEINDKFVFPNQVNPRKTMSNSTILRGLYQLGYKGKLTGHGFRATAMSAIQEKLGYRYEVVDRQLAHAPKDKMHAAYSRATFLDERTEMMQDWADYIDRSKEGA